MLKSSHLIRTCNLFILCKKRPSLLLLLLATGEYIEAEAKLTHTHTQIPSRFANVNRKKVKCFPISTLEKRYFQELLLPEQGSERSCWLAGWLNEKETNTEQQKRRSIQEKYY